MNGHGKRFFGLAALVMVVALFLLSACASPTGYVKREPILSPLPAEAATAEQPAPPPDKTDLVLERLDKQTQAINNLAQAIKTGPQPAPAEPAGLKAPVPGHFGRPPAPPIKEEKIVEGGPVTRSEFDGLKKQVALNSGHIAQLDRAVKEIALRIEGLAPGDKVVFHLYPFAPGRSELTPAMRKQLDAVIVMVKDGKIQLEEIRGYTDVRGGEQKNQELSQQRAQAARDYLVRCCLNLDPASVRVVGMGETSLHGYHAQNRAVVITAKKL